jgi:hypothetical protein
VNGINVVAGIVEKDVGVGLLVRKMRRDQRKIGRAQPPKQVVVRPYALIQIAGSPRIHARLPCAHDNRS